MERPDYAKIEMLEYEFGIRTIQEIQQDTQLLEIRLRSLEQIAYRDPSARIQTADGPVPVQQLIDACTIKPGKQWWE